MKSIKKVDYDQFYTKEDIAKTLISLIDFSKFDLAIDPSAGNGAFYKNISIEKIGFDIDPKSEDIIEQDFLKWDYSNLKGKILTITNPPFGRNASLAIKFFNISANFSNTIAFIFPRSLKKESMQNRLNSNFHLKLEKDLPENSFIMNGEKYNVPCVFQVWERSDKKRDKYKQVKPIGFQYVKNWKDADLVIRRVGVYAGHCEISKDKSKESHYFIKILKNIDLNILIENINNIQWIDKTTGPRSIAKTELTPFINNLLKF